MALSPEAKAIGDRSYFPTPITTHGMAITGYSQKPGITIREQAVMTFMAAHVPSFASEDALSYANECADAYLESLAAAAKALSALKLAEYEAANEAKQHG